MIISSAGKTKEKSKCDKCLIICAALVHGNFLCTFFCAASRVHKGNQCCIKVHGNFNVPLSCVVCHKVHGDSNVPFLMC